MTSHSVSNFFSLSRAGRWFLDSGIQEPSGGVARYHFIAENRNARISTEITGYAVSALLELESRLDSPEFAAAAEAAGILLCEAWDSSCHAMPFEWAEDGALPERHSYFFDNGIIARGLLRLWRRTGETRYLDTALRCGDSMRLDFVNGEDIHPILELPSKRPVPRDARWSRSSDCYQLKSALAWLELDEHAPGEGFAAHYESALQRALRSHRAFFDHEPDPSRVMDRLHAYCYFLEAIQPRAERPEVRAALEDGIHRAAFHHRRVRSVFERSDVNAQILRVRLWAHAAGAVPLDEPAAAEEAAWAAAYQMNSSEPRLDGGFNFGRRGGGPSNFSNPVSTAFCLQALAMWQDHLEGRPTAGWRTLI